MKSSFTRTFPSIASIAAAALLAVPLILAVVLYPLPSWIIAFPLLAYAALLWWRPVSFLLIVPLVLPAWDLGMWTGWMMVSESDLFILTTVIVLLIRTPLGLDNLLPSGLAGAVLLAFTASWAIATITGLYSTLGAPPSDIAFLRPDNAIRTAKGLLEALVLLPFLRQRHRLHGDAVSWLGCGMALGIGAVSIIVLAERALFTTVLDFTGEYRVSGPFFSMCVGGGHIGAYFALALPMALCLMRHRTSALGIGLLLLTFLLGGYGLAVTFARTAYAAGAIGLTVAGIVWLVASRRRFRFAALGLVPILLVLAALGSAATDTGMRQRFLESAQDLTTREGNWRAGMAVRDDAILPSLFGMGLGTYQRAMAMRSAVNRPGDIVVQRDGDGRYLSMRVEAPLYLGQKITPPGSGGLRLSLLARSVDLRTTLGFALCDKVLLYSDNCRGNSVVLLPGVWQEVAATLPAGGLGGYGQLSGVAGLGWLRRPVELSLFGGPADHHLDIRGVRLLDETGRDVLVNGDFRRGLDRWTFTDDDHLAWRMKDLYLMLWFQTGVVGVAAFFAFSGIALAGGIRAALSGTARSGGGLPGAAVAGSIAAFLVSGLFDDLVEPTRLATLFFLVCLCGLMQWENKPREPS